jgi:8-oxo-dGTP diphosphatase
MIHVVCAVIEGNDGRLLACRRSPEQSMPGKWEFPGGKVEIDENAEDALIREIREELGCAIHVASSLPVVEHDYPEFSIRLIPYLCSLEGRSVPQILEHAEMRWVTVADCAALDWAEADVPIWSALLNGERGDAACSYEW